MYLQYVFETSSSLFCIYYASVTPVMKQKQQSQVEICIQDWEIGIYYLKHILHDLFIN